MADEAWIVVDLGFGDQGKGTTVDFLVRGAGAHTVVRYNGGPQAAHNVVTDDGRHHTFAQLGSGSFVPGVVTVLAGTMAISPWSLLVEAEQLARAGGGDGLARLLVSEDALVVTPFHRAANRLRERARGAARHGSCGVGLGEARADAIAGGPSVRARDLSDHAHLTASLRAIQDDKRALVALAEGLDDDDVRAAVDDLEEPRLPAFASELLAGFRRRVRVVPDEVIAARLAAPGVIVCEGAHGVLLDEDVGFHPHTTWSDCTDRHARALISAMTPNADIHALGILRAYTTRHGAGPLPSEWAATDERARALTEPHNTDGPWQGPFRVGAFDAVLARYARDRVGPLDGLALTCLDRVRPPICFVDSYRVDGARVDAVPFDAAPTNRLAAQEALGRELGRALPVVTTLASEDALLAAIDASVAPVVLTSHGPTASSKRWR